MGKGGVSFSGFEGLGNFLKGLDMKQKIAIGVSILGLCMVIAAFVLW